MLKDYKISEKIKEKGLRECLRRSCLFRTASFCYNELSECKKYERFVSGKSTEIPVMIGLSKRRRSIMDQPKILVVDDDREIVGAIKKRLEM